MSSLWYARNAPTDCPLHKGHCDLISHICWTINWNIHRPPLSVYLGENESDFQMQAKYQYLIIFNHDFLVFCLLTLLRFLSCGETWLNGCSLCADPLHGYLNTSFRWCSRWKPWQRGKPGPRELHRRPSSSPSHPTVPPHTPGQGHPGAGQQWPGHTHTGTDLWTTADTDRSIHPMVSLDWLFLYLSGRKFILGSANMLNWEFQLCVVWVSIDWLIN